MRKHGFTEDFFSVKGGFGGEELQLEPRVSAKPLPVRYISRLIFLKRLIMKQGPATLPRLALIL